MMMIINNMFFLVLLLCVQFAFADGLQNSDFETPPSNLSPFRQLNETSSVLPGWSFKGTIFYVSTTNHTHAIQLAQDGKINQTFSPVDNLNYLLTLTIIAPALVGQNCSVNASIVISAAAAAADIHANVSFKPSYGDETGEISYGVNLGSWEQGEFVNLIIESQVTESDSNNDSSTCWPLIDMVLLKSLETSVPGTGTGSSPGGIKSENNTGSAGFWNWKGWDFMGFVTVIILCGLLVSECCPRIILHIRTNNVQNQ